MCTFFRFKVIKACLNIMFLDYIYNKNTERNLDLYTNVVFL
jgi:hypothetical protein